MTQSTSRKVATIGLTGGIGSGKSAAARILAGFGAQIIDADKVGHEIYRPGEPAYEAVVAAFGDRIVAADGAIDRKQLGAIVFADSAQLRRLEKIVHPLMFDRMREKVRALRQAGNQFPIVIEAAILIEAGWQPLFDEIWLVVAPRDAVLRRVEQERGLKPEQTQARIDAQLSDAERRIHATAVIENDSTLEQLAAKLRLLWDSVLRRTTAASA